MAFDTSFYSQIKPIEIANPLAQAAQFAQLQDAQNRNRLADLVFGEKQREVADSAALNEAYKGAFGPDGKLDRSKFISSAIERNLGSKLPALQKTWAEQDKGEADLNKSRTEALVKATELHRDQLAGVNDPQTAAQWVMAGFKDPILAPLLSRSGTVEQAIARIPTDPAQFEAWKRQNALGATKFIEQSKPVIQTRNTGGTTDTLAINPWTGTPAVTSSIKNTQSPDSVASERTATAGRAQAERHFQANQNTPQYMETEQGVVALPKKVPSGQTIVAQPVMGQDGKPLPGKTNAAKSKELMSIDQQMSIIDGALEAVKSTPNAFTFKRGLATMAGSIPESLAGRMDNDQERQARAYVFNNVSKVITERAGTAQSKQEAARLRSFLPAETDGPEQIVSKFNGFKQYLADLKSGTTGSKPVESVVKVKPANQVPAGTVKFLGFE